MKISGLFSPARCFLPRVQTRRSRSEVLRALHVLSFRFEEALARTPGDEAELAALSGESHELHDLLAALDEADPTPQWRG